MLAALLASPPDVAQAQQRTRSAGCLYSGHHLAAGAGGEGGRHLREERPRRDLHQISQHRSICRGTLGKQFDLAPSTAPDLLNAVASGLNIAAVAGETLETSANKSFQVMVRPDSGINSMKDLAGKRVAGPGVGSVMHVAMLYQVAKEGGDPQQRHRPRSAVHRDDGSAQIRPGRRGRAA